MLTSKVKQYTLAGRIVHDSLRARHCRTRTLAVCATVLLNACAARIAPASEIRWGPCVSRDPLIKAIGPAAHTHDRSELDEWCVGTGPGVSLDASVSAVSSDSLLLISWNVHIGKAAIEPLIAFLQDIVGEGQPLVIFLQEVYSTDGVPNDVALSVPNGGKTAGPQADISSVAKASRLSVVYVPSMRNAATARGGASDRGNAILTNLQMSDRVAYELPFEIQRRAAASGVVKWVTGSGRQYNLRVTSAHFDTHGRRPFPPLEYLNEEGRARQARGLLAMLPETAPAVLAGDFNTAFRQHEPVVDVLRERFVSPGKLPSGHTHWLGFRLDYILLQPADAWFVCSKKLPGGRRGSDHHPLFAWIVSDGNSARRSAGSGNLRCTI